MHSAADDSDGVGIKFATTECVKGAGDAAHESANDTADEFDGLHTCIVSFSSAPFLSCAVHLYDGTMHRGAWERFDHVLVLRNPVSTHASRGKAYIAELRNVFRGIAVHVINTKSGGAEPNRKLLRSLAPKLGPRTLLCVASGDGTVSMVIEALLTDPDMPKYAHETVILPLWTGNANDLAHMLNGPAYRNRLRAVLESGKVVQIRPMVCMLTGRDGTVQNKMAACYASFGATAFATERLSQDDMRSSVLHKVPGIGFLTEFITGFKAAVHAPFFRLEERGAERVVYERVYMNGSRFAKVERLPLRLTDDAFLEHTLTERNLTTVFSQLWRAMQKSLVDRFRVDQSEFVVRERVAAQFDGELMDVAAGTQVRLYVSPLPFYALSLLLESAG